jgi:hypothetical protein
LGGEELSALRVGSIFSVSLITVISSLITKITMLYMIDIRVGLLLGKNNSQKINVTCKISNLSYACRL